MRIIHGRLCDNIVAGGVACVETYSSGSVVPTRHMDWHMWSNVSMYAAEMTSKASAYGFYPFYIGKFGDVPLLSFPTRGEGIRDRNIIVSSLYKIEQIIDNIETTVLVPSFSTREWEYVIERYEDMISDKIILCKP